MQTQMGLQRRWGCRRFLQDFRRHLDKRRGTFRNVGGRQLSSGAFHHVERATMRVENPSRPFHNQAVQVSRTNRLGKCLAEAVQKIEDERLFDLNLFLGTLELANPVALLLPGKKPSRETRHQQPEKNNWPHAPGAELVRRRLVVEILF